MTMTTTPVTGTAAIIDIITIILNPCCIMMNLVTLPEARFITPDPLHAISNSSS